jgi:hypothetical protein
LDDLCNAPERPLTALNYRTVSGSAGDVGTATAAPIMYGVLMVTEPTRRTSVTSSEARRTGTRFEPQQQELRSRA